MYCEPVETQHLEDISSACVPSMIPGTDGLFLRTELDQSEELESSIPATETPVGLTKLRVGSHSTPSRKSTTLMKASKG